MGATEVMDVNSESANVEIIERRRNEAKVRHVGWPSEFYEWISKANLIDHE